MTFMPSSAPPNSPAVTCSWCGAPASAEDLSCPRCGAPLTFHPQTDDSGWIEQPAIENLTRLRIGPSTCQIEGIYVPIADFNLADGDSVFFAHHTLLWRDAAVEVRLKKITTAMNTLLGGIRIVMASAHGPGHIAFSRDEPGELIALPLQPGQHVYVREHLFLAGAGDLHFDYTNPGIYFRTGRGKEAETRYPIGMVLSDLHAGAGPALVLLHAGGNAFVRELALGQSMLIKPGSLIYKDPSVWMDLHIDNPLNAQFKITNRRIIWIRLTGPGRVAVQSAYEHFEDDGMPITYVSPRLAPAHSRLFNGPSSS
jgi:uncharacterized protein (AIM24 family)